MKKWFNLFALGLALLSLLAQAGERKQTAWQMIQQGALVVDVRSDREFVTGHLQNVLSIPHPQVVAPFANLAICKDRAVMLYCRSGQRAGNAEAALRWAGYTRICNGGGHEALMKVVM